MQTWTRRSATSLMGIVLLALLVTACGDAAGALQPLDGRTFLSVSVTKGGVNQPLVPGTQIRLNFKDGQIGLSAGCNIIGGTYRLAGARLVVDAAGMTEMGCDDARHAQDDWLATFMSSRPTIRLTGNELVLDDGATVITLADRRVVDPDLGLVGPTWTVDSIISGQAVSSIPDGVVATLQFAADGSVRVNTSCNTGTSQVEVAGGTIRFGPIALTKKACPGAAGEMEAAVLAVLRSEQVGYKIEARTLTLTAGDRGLQLRGS
jgi:heat shock protein HslJ